MNSATVLATTFGIITMPLSILGLVLWVVGLRIKRFSLLSLGYVVFMVIVLFFLTEAVHANNATGWTTYGGFALAITAMYGLLMYQATQADEPAEEQLDILQQ